MNLSIYSVGGWVDFQTRVPWNW